MNTESKNQIKNVSKIQITTVNFKFATFIKRETDITKTCATILKTCPVKRVWVFPL